MEINTLCECRCGCQSDVIPLDSGSQLGLCVPCWQNADADPEQAHGVRSVQAPTPTVHEQLRLLHKVLTDLCRPFSDDGETIGGTCYWCGGEPNAGGIVIHDIGCAYSEAKRVLALVRPVGRNRDSDGLSEYDNVPL